MIQTPFELFADVNAKLTPDRIKEGKRLARETRARLAKKAKLDEIP